MTHQPCPICQQPIRLEAVKCRHCKRVLATPPRSGLLISRDFVVPLLVLLGAFGVAVVFVAVGRHSAATARTAAPQAIAAVGAPDAGVAPKPTIPGEPGPRTAAQASTPPVAAPPDDPAAASPISPRVPAAASAPLGWPPPGGTGARAANAAPPSAAAPGPPTPVPPTPSPAPPSPAPERFLKSDLFGYSIRLPNEPAWRMAVIGAARHTIARRDGTARVYLQALVRLPGDKTGPAACFGELERALRRRFGKTRLRAYRSRRGQRKGAHGISILTREWKAEGSGPRRHAGRYLIGVAAVKRLCFTFVGHVDPRAPDAAMAEVRRAQRTFDVDATAVTRSGSEETLQNLIGMAGAAQARGNGALLTDAATALVSLWPSRGQSWHLLAVGFLLLNRPKRALAALAQARAREGKTNDEGLRMTQFSRWLLAADAEVRLKRWSRVKRALGQARKIYADHPALTYASGCVEAMQGNVDKALRLLEAAFRSWPARPVPPRIPHGLLVQVRIARRDLRLRQLRQDSRFEVLLRRFEARARKGQ